MKRPDRERPGASTEKRRVVAVVPSAYKESVGMREIGVRELREHLSRVLADVQGGTSVVVTRAGEPIARIEPVHPAAPPEVQRLLASGRASWGGRSLEPREPVAIGPGPDVSDILLSQRGADDVVSGQ